MAGRARRVRRPSFCCIQIFSAVVASLWHLLATATAWGAVGRLCVCVCVREEGEKLLLEGNNK